MAIVTAALFGILLIAAAVWIGAIWSAASADRRERERLAVEAAEIRRREERDRRMRTDAMLLLRCASCDAAFAGPLTERGCPNCQSAAFVVPDDEYRVVQHRGEFPQEE